jgi:hypothetical protein
MAVVGVEPADGESEGSGGALPGDAELLPAVGVGDPVTTPAFAPHGR